MGILNLGKSKILNASGAVTPNFLLTGMCEIHADVSATNIHVNTPTNILSGDTSVFFIKFVVPTDLAAESVSVTWSNYYALGSPFTPLVAVYPRPEIGQNCWTGMFFVDEGKGVMILRTFLPYP